MRSPYDRDYGDDFGVDAHPGTETIAARRRQGRRRRVRIAAMLVAASCGVAAAVWWPTVVAQARAVVILASLLELPVVEPVVRAVTREPERADIDLAGMPTRVYRPTGDGPWPGVLFITGADAGGRESDDIAALGEGLARAGYITLVPDLPGLTSGTVSTTTLDGAEAVLRAATDHPEVAGDRVALTSVSAGASLALVVAARPEASKRISVVAGIAPFTRVRTVLQIATTGGFTNRAGEVENYRTEDWLRAAVAASLFEATNGNPLIEGAERALLRQDDPIAALRRIDEDQLPGEGSYAPMIALLRNEDPRRFDDLYEALPREMRSEVDALSPLATAAELSMPVELASSPRDTYFPIEEAQLLVDAAPNARLTITDALDHARPKRGLSAAGGLVDLDAYIVRVLQTSAERAK